MTPQHDIDATASAPGAAPTPRRATWPAGCSCSATTTCARHTGHPPTAPYTQIHFRFDTDTMPGHPHEFLHVTVQNDDRSRVVHYCYDSWTSTWRRPGPGGNPLGADLAGVQAAAVTWGSRRQPATSRSSVSQRRLEAEALALRREAERAARELARKAREEQGARRRAEQEAAQARAAARAAEIAALAFSLQLAFDLARSVALARATDIVDLGERSNAPPMSEARSACTADGAAPVTG